MFSHSLKMDVVCACSIMLLIPAVVVSKAEEPEAAALNELLGTNLAGLQAYTLHVELEKPLWSNWPEQGTYRKTCTITQSGGSLVIACRAHLPPDLVYVPEGTGGYDARDFDHKGNLYVTVPQRELGLLTSDRNETYEESDVFAIDADGVVVISASSRTLKRYRPDDKLNSGGPSETKQIWWALGQDLRASFRSLASTTTQPDGRVSLRLRGGLDRGLREGNWNVILDPVAGNLIRSASLQFDGSDYPVVEIETSGLRRFEEWVLPENGLVRFSLGQAGQSLEKRIVLRDFSERPDENLFVEVREALDNAGTHGLLTVYDYRENPSQPRVAHENR